MRRELPRLAAIALVITLTGCSVLRILTGSGPRPPARELYRLTLPDTGAGHASGVADAPLVGTLAVTSYVTAGVYSDPGIVYRLGDSQYGAYPNREWAVPLGEQLGALTERVLTRIPISSEPAVFDPPSRRAQTYIWRGTVRELEEVNRGTEVRAAVRIDVRIVRSLDDSIMWSGSGRAEVPASAADMPGIVRTLSVLADSVIAEIAMRARRELTVPTPTAGAPPE